jgi:hypothetical protein
MERVLRGRVLNSVFKTRLVCVGMLGGESVGREQSAMNCTFESSDGYSVAHCAHRFAFEPPQTAQPVLQGALHVL